MGHWVQKARGLDDTQGNTASSTTHELGADCLAGVSMAASATPAELAAAEQGMAKVLGGDAAHHGTTQDQIAAFHAGASTGDCSAFGIPNPVN